MRARSSDGAERFPYKEEAGGSSPSAPTCSPSVPTCELQQRPFSGFIDGTKSLTVRDQGERLSGSSESGHDESDASACRALADEEGKRQTRRERVNSTDVDVLEWAYEGPGAPAEWGSLSPDYVLCASGERQSPIDITGYRDSVGPAISFSYDGEIESVERHGRFAYAVFSPGNGITVGGRFHELRQAHAHAPSEHTIDGQSFDVEVHLVHENASGELAVVGLLYRLGLQSTVIEALLDVMPEADGTPVNTTPGIVAADFLPDDLGYFAYDGSLTTPPCSEGVSWMIMRSVATVSQDQVNRLMAYGGGGPTNRPLQPLGSRVINAVVSS